ncbi:MAG: PpiC-type peptidyl-prolyl cis-trans isomerase, partial [Burkholderiaceae bacterium]|nr:PpiC-type peptidyl-prolyl cis-trans isomerase [Burkholderiaceae bacterium]
MNFIKSRLLAAGAASVLALGACNPSKDAKPDQASAGPVVATVNGMAINQRTVDMIAKQAGHSGRPDTPESRAEIIEQLALQMVIAEEAVKKGLDKSPEVADQLDTIKKSVLANAYVQDFIKNNPVSDDALKAEYDRIK